MIKEITKIILLTIGLSLSLVALSSESYKNDPVYLTMGAKEFFNKQCSRACIEAIVGISYSARALTCEVDKKDYKSNPNKYQWLKTIGNWKSYKFEFGIYTNTFINWQASKVLVEIDAIEKDLRTLEDVMIIIMYDSSKEVKTQCEAVGGEFDREIGSRL
jgi:hypothetical protein